MTRDWTPERAWADAEPMPPLSEPESAPVRVGSTGTTAWGRGALKDECRRVVMAADGEQNNVIYEASCRLRDLAAGGALDQAEAIAALDAAASEGGHPATRARATIRSAFRAPATPRSAPERTSKPAQNQPAKVNPEPLIPQIQWSEFRDRADADTEYLIDGLWPEGAATLFIGAPPKSGKTWLALSQALAMATGQPWAGRAVRQQSVVYVALEGSAAGLRTRVGCLARGLGVDPDSDDLDSVFLPIYKPRGLSLSDPNWARALAKLVKEREAGVVFIDTLRSAADVHETNEGARDFAKLLRHLNALLADGVSIVWLHHFSKWSDQRDQRDVADRMTGTGALRGHMDVGMFITGYDRAEYRFRVEHEARDIVTLDPFGLRLDGPRTGQHGGYGYDDAVTVEPDIDPLTRTTDAVVPAGAIAAWIREQPDRQATPIEIKKQFGISKDTLRRRKKLILLNGIDYISNGAHSYYQAPETTP